MRHTLANTLHGMRWAPESRPGRFAPGLAGVSVAGMGALVVAFALGLEPAESFTDNWLLTGAGLAVLASGAAALVAGLLALLRRHDRSWLVLLATVAGLYTTAMMLLQVVEGL